MEPESQTQTAAVPRLANRVTLCQTGHASPLWAERKLINRISASAPVGSEDLERDFFSVLTDDGPLHVNLWPRVVAIEQPGPGEPWRSREPHLDVGAGLIARRCDEPPARLVEWVSTPPRASTGDLWVWGAVSRIPKQVREVIAPFRFGQWSLLRLASAHPRFLDLMASNPALGWMLANWGTLRGTPSVDPLATARVLVPLRQRNIAEWVGFPQTEAAVRVIRRIPPTDCSMMAYRALSILMVKPGALDVFGHFHRLPVVVLMAAATESIGPRLTEHFFRQFAKAISTAHPEDDADGDGSPAQILEDTVRLQAGLPDVPLPGQIRSLAALTRFHDQLVAEQDFRAEYKRDFALPPPPIPPCDGIEPLDTARKIFVEANGQHHCLDTYMVSIQARGYYAYSVTRNGRATVGIRRKRDGSWRVDQIRGAYNSKVPVALTRFVRQWFLSHASIPATSRARKRRVESDLQILMPFAQG